MYTVSYELALTLEHFMWFHYPVMTILPRTASLDGGVHNYLVGTVNGRHCKS